MFRFISFHFIPGTIGLTESQQAFLDAAEDLAENEFAPHAAEWDANKIFPEHALRQAAEMGFAGILVEMVQQASLM